jgi:predicted ATPase
VSCREPDRWLDGGRRSPRYASTSRRTVPYRAVVLLGDAGVGKSRLVTEISALDEFLVFLGWCLPHSEGLPFLPVVDLLRGIQRYEPTLSAQSLAASPPYVAVELRRVLPELAEAPDDIGAPPHEPWMRTRLFDALAQFFANLVSPRPIVLALEDIHWADTTTLEFLDYLLSPGRGPSGQAAADVPIGRDTPSRRRRLARSTASAQ